MVKYKYILQAIEKTHYTLKGIQEQIEPTIRKITNNEDEYNILMETIPKFYRDYWNKDKEYMTLVTYDNTQYTVKGDEESVKRDDKLKEEDNEYILTIHNHPNHTCFQSQADYMSLTDTLETYGITIGNDGIMITEFKDGEVTKADIGLIYREARENDIFREFMKSDEYKQFEDDFHNRRPPFNIDDLDERMMVYEEQRHKEENKFISNNTQKCTEIINNKFQEYNVDIKSTHIPIKKPYE